MAKKTVKKNEVTPNPKEVKVGICFDALDEGDYFIMGGQLWQKADECECDQSAINSLTGEIQDDLCDETVIPVTVKITWEVT